MSEHRLTERLRAATRELHTAAERSGVMASLLAGRMERDAYCMLLRNLHAIYAALERALERHADAPVVAPVRLPPVYRTAALAADLAFLHGAGFAHLPLAPAAADYAAHIDTLADERPALLGAHAYVRYLGDLNGGQLLRRIVKRSLALPDAAGTAFYAFGTEDEVRVYRDALRRGLDRLPATTEVADGIVDEARAAFARHLDLFADLARLPAVPR